MDKKGLMEWNFVSVTETIPKSFPRTLQMTFLSVINLWMVNQKQISFKIF